MVDVAVTGVGGLLGRAVVRSLAADDRIGTITGLDVATPTDLEASGLRLRELDVRDPALAGALRGSDVVIHLAFQLDPLRDRDEMRSINVDGTRNVSEAAITAGVGHVVYVSSAAVYGAHPDNDFPLREDSSLRANPDFGYVEDKREVELWLEGFRRDHPDLGVTILRPAIVAGRGVDNFIVRAFEQPRYVSVVGHRPPFQFVHVEDVASAIHHAVIERLDGAYNVAADGWLSLEEILAIAGKRRSELPEEVAFSLLDRLWRVGLGTGPAGQVHYLMHPWVVSNEKLAATGWRPKHSNRDALAELVEDHRDRIALGRVVADRATVRRAALGSLAVAGGLVALGVLSRRRGRDEGEGTDA